MGTPAPPMPGLLSLPASDATLHFPLELLRTEGDRTDDCACGADAAFRLWLRKLCFQMIDDSQRG